MKQKIILSLIFLMGSLCAVALEWHDSLMDYMMALPINDKQIVVERDEKYMRIKRASYRFSFERRDVERNVYLNLVSHMNEAIKYSHEKGELLMQVKEEPNTYYTYKFGKDPKNPRRYLLLISVTTGKKP